MKKYSAALLAVLLTAYSYSQKVTVQLSGLQSRGGFEWQILDNELLPVASGQDFFKADSIAFGLEENSRFFLEISVTDSLYDDTILLRLYVNSEPVLLIRSNLDPGDYFYPFYTGVRTRQVKVTGGTDADISEFPWQVYFESGNYSCGGTIISPGWILTAAHCTEDDFGNLTPASAMDVIVGANNPRNPGEGKKYLVDRVIRHQNYNAQTMNNDIALLKLSTSIDYPNATPIRIISKIDSAAGATDPGVMAWLTGYGLTKAYPPTYPLTLQKVQLPIVSNTQASTIWPDIAPTDMMAGYHSGNRDACNGDSGGPLIVAVDNEFKVAGIVSWGSSSCDTYGAYTRVSLFQDWINSNTGIEISYVPPVPGGDSIVCAGTATSGYSVGAIDGATAYEWQLLPAEAGSILGNSEQATVTWAPGYTGAATVRLRVTRYGFPSYWSALTVHIAKYNNLLASSGDMVICAGQSVTLNVVSEGYNLNYSWYRDGDLISSGASSRLPLSNLPVDATGTYRCDISGSCGGPLSSEIALSVLPVTVIQDISPDREAYFGDNVTLDVASDGYDLSYQWQKDSVLIPSANNPEYLMADVNASNTGLYRVDVTGACGEVISKNIYVYVSDKSVRGNAEISVWPTVSSGQFNVAVSSDLTYSLSLFNTSGSLLIDRHNCQYKTTIDIAYLPAGVYILKISGSNFSKSVKLIRN